MTKHSPPPAPPKHVNHQSDILIIGAGLAGLYTALKLAPYPVTLVSPFPLGEATSSNWAQGGIAAAIGEGDHPDKHAADTILAGGALVDQDMAHLLAHDAPDAITDLLSYGVPFDRDLEGKLKLSREAAHSARRIIRVKGDMAGRAIMQALISKARSTPSITLLEGYSVHALASAQSDREDKHICGAWLWPMREEGLPLSFNDSQNAAPFFLPARAVILATGGVGGLYKTTTNPPYSRGEGIALAARLGAKIIDAEFVQFHPTALDINLDPAPLATEALRGEGAHLINKAGKRFMLDHHRDGELAPRDMVARAVHTEIISGRGAYLDCRTQIGARFEKDFPTVFDFCKQAGLDPLTQPIPIAPAAHYHMGGVYTDKDGRTTIAGLWACGEVASTGVHGANRLASNSLLEAVVFARRIAKALGADITSGAHSQSQNSNDTPAQVSFSPSATSSNAEQTDYSQDLATLRVMMSQYAGVVRTQDGLAKLVQHICALEQKYQAHPLMSNILLSAHLIAYSALHRTHSIGAHYRADEGASEQRQSAATHSAYQLHDIEDAHAYTCTSRSDKISNSSHQILDSTPV